MNKRRRFQAKRRRAMARRRSRRTPLVFHPDAFSFVWPPIVVRVDTLYGTGVVRPIPFILTNGA